MVYMHNSISGGLAESFARFYRDLAEISRERANDYYKHYTLLSPAQARLELGKAEKFREKSERFQKLANQR